jgi:hypothetical protein
MLSFLWTTITFYNNKLTKVAQLTKIAQSGHPVHLSETVFVFT